jgi:hypothetical protein
MAAAEGPERRLGEMMAAEAKAPSARDMKGNQYTGKELMKVSEKPPPTLAEVDIDKNLAHRADKPMPDRLVTEFHGYQKGRSSFSPGASPSTTVDYGLGWSGRPPVA